MQVTGGDFTVGRKKGGDSIVKKRQTKTGGGMKISSSEKGRRRNRGNPDPVVERLLRINFAAA